MHETTPDDEIVIASNEAVCMKCMQRIVSKYRHDFVSCSCRGVFVDGGGDYLRRGGVNYVDTSVIVKRSSVSAVLEAMKWADDNNRNELGKALAVFRAIAKCGDLANYDHADLIASVRSIEEMKAEGKKILSDEQHSAVDRLSSESESD